MAASTSASTTPANEVLSTALVEIKKGKIVFKQKPISFEKLSETMQEIVKFRAMLSDLNEKKSAPLTQISDEHLPVIAKLVHESDKSTSVLVKQLQKHLIPGDDTSSDPAVALLPGSVLESAVTSLASRVNYGVDVSPTGGKLPAALSIWRWEVKYDKRHWLPQSAKDKTEARIAERVQAKRDLAALIEALPQDEKEELFKLKAAGIPKSAPNGTDSGSIAKPERATLENGSPSKTSSLAHSPSKENLTDNNRDVDELETSPHKPRGRQKNPETIAKEKEKQERKVAKEEKERKAQQANDKAKSMMVNFFGKSKAPVAAPVAQAGPSIPSVSRESPAAPAQLPEVDEFARAFRPFVVKKETELAPINYFLSRRAKGKAREVIEIGDSQDNVIIVDEDVRMDVCSEIPVTNKPPLSPTTLALQSSQERLHTLVKSLPLPVPGPKRHSHRHSVRNLMLQLSEAEVTGDAALVRSCLDRLGNRSLVPAKIFIFHEDNRPGYYGTHTKTSSFIRLRQPFKKDPVALDYSYDSGEEWEGEEEGAGDDVADGDEEEDIVDEDDDSDADSWLVDDDDVELPNPDRSSPFSDMSLTEMSLGPDMLPPPQTPPKKRRIALLKEDKPKIEKKRRVVVPLIPFTKGPCWEDEIGVCEYEPFEAYRIQLFNDTPFGIDPFTFVSTAVEDMKVAKQTSTSSTAPFAIPAVPDHAMQDVTAISPLSTPSVEGSGTPKTRGVLNPKVIFPDALLPTLIAKIDQLKSGSMLLVVESTYQALKAQKVKKNAVEAKIRDICEKTGTPKVWTVKADVRAMHPPAGSTV